LVDGVDGEVARLQQRARPFGALLDGILDRLADAAIVGGLGMWALENSNATLVVVLVVFATASSMLSMASKDRIAALGLQATPEVGPGYALGGRDGRLLLVAASALIGYPLLALVSVTVTSTIAVSLRASRVRA
jgi:phosphatidylglycerophosphate synthase